MYDSRSSGYSTAMALHIPPILPWVVIGDDAHLLARISARLARRNAYLPILDGPRLSRPDADAEVLRRNNAAARVQPEHVLFAGLPDATVERFSGHFPPRRILRVEQADDLPTGQMKRNASLAWGHDNIGLGLLRALRARTDVHFESSALAPRDAVPTRSGHLVVCEDGDNVCQVIAANYAFALDAGLHLIPKMPAQESDELLEQFYSVYDSRERSPTSILEDLKRRMRAFAGPLSIPPGGSLTFVCKEIPWGFAFPEVPSSHLFSYPDLGISIINGITSEQPGTDGIRVASILDPGAVDAKEVGPAVRRLMDSGVFSMGIRSTRATVERAVHLVEAFPYDFLLISTHCGDAPGWRWTYEFTDSEGLARRLVVDIAIGVEYRPGDANVHVTQFMRFVSLDGVDWHDPDKKAKLYVGRAMLDFIERTRGDNAMEPVSKEHVDRVPGSMALKMADDNYIAIPYAVAGGGAPIVLSNACASWHRLASSFTFGNARAYLGTLFSIIDPEAEGVTEKLFGPYWQKPLSVALWRAQNDLWPGSVRRPYAMVGCHFQRLRSVGGPGALREAVLRIHDALAHWNSRLKRDDVESENVRRRIETTVEFLDDQRRAIDAWMRRGVGKVPGAAEGPSTH